MEKQVKFKLSGNYLISAKDKEDSKERTKEILKEVVVKVENVLENSKITFQITDVIEDGAKYSEELDEFEVNFILLGYENVPGLIEEPEEYVNKKINDNIQLLETQIVMCGLVDDDGYVTSVEPIKKETNEV